MAITYGAGPGTHITSPAMTEVLPNQSQQTGNNTVVVSDTLGNIGGGQIGDGTDGVGDSYVSRLIVINLGTGTEQARRCITDAAGTGTTRILTVDADWDTNPVITTDTIYVGYELADIENGGAGGGINLSTRTGLWELSNVLTVDSTGLLAAFDGQGLEMDDRGANESFIISSGGWFWAGQLTAGGTAIQGIQMTTYNGAAGEPSLQVQSGGHLRLYDTLIWGQLVAQQLEFADGADVETKGVKFLSVAQELFLYDAVIAESSVSGRAGASEIVRVDAGSMIDGMVLSGVQVLDSRADTVTETLEAEGLIFVGVPSFVDIRQNKTWNMIDAVGMPIVYTGFTWTGTSTGNELNDRHAIKATIKEADGTLLQNALVNVYENTVLADLVLELTTDVNGYAEDSFIAYKHATNSVTTTYGGHALQVGKWLYLPVVFAQVSTAKFEGDIVLASDPNIVQTTQATALTDGSGITWSEPTNPTELIDFTAGSGTLAVGMILTFSPSGAVGTLRESASGDSVAGELYLDARNATAIGATDTFSRTGGTAGTFSGTYTNTSKQPFSISINGNSKSQQTIYDYLAAKQNETTLSADGELIWEWCRSAQSQPFYATGSSFFTERSNSKGIYIYDRGAGTLDYLTDDAGNTWTPPASVTVAVTVLDDDTGLAIATTARVYIADTATKTQIMSSATDGSGIASISYVHTVDVPIVGWAREQNLAGTDYEQKDFTGVITASGFSQTVRLTPIT